MDIFPNWTVFPIVFFLIVLTFVLNRTFFRPLGETLEERKRRIQGARKEAEEIRAASQQRLVEFEKRMREARRASDLQMASIKNQALSERESILSQKRSETEKMLSEARQDIRKRTKEAKGELEAQSGTFALRIASQILKRPLSKRGVQA